MSSHVVMFTNRVYVSSWPHYQCSCSCSAPVIDPHSLCVQLPLSVSKLHKAKPHTASYTQQSVTLIASETTTLELFCSGFITLNDFQFVNSSIGILKDIMDYIKIGFTSLCVLFLTCISVSSVSSQGLQNFITHASWIICQNPGKCCLNLPLSWHFY